jgi:hypothetical protein
MKLKSRQSIMETTTNPNAKDVDSTVTDPNTICKSINERAYQIGLSLVPKEKLDFYNKHGDKYVFTLDAAPIVQAG